MNKELIGLYKDILAYANMKADGDGYIFWNFNKDSEPVVENGKRLVLPTLDHLKNPMEKIIFHPLSETFTQTKVPPVINVLRRSINSRLNVGCFVLAKSLLMLAASPELHQQLDPDQLALLVKLKDVDKTTVTNFINVGTKGMMKHNDRNFTSIYLKRGGSIGDVRYARVSVVSSHFYSELLKDNKDNTIYDLKVRSKDRQMFKAVMEYIFPQIAEESAYNFGTNDTTAPWLHALMMGSLRITSCFSDIMANFDKYVDEKDTLNFNFDWVTAFDNLEKWGPLIRQIPLQSSGEPVQPVAPVAPVAPIPQPPNALFQQQPQQPFNQPQNGLVHTERGLDFNSVLRNSPSVAQTVFQTIGNQSVPMMGMGLNAPRQPSWAQTTIPTMNNWQQQQPIYQQANTWQQPNAGWQQPSALPRPL